MLDIYIGNLPRRASVEDVRGLVGSLVGEYILSSCTGAGLFARLWQKMRTKLKGQRPDDAPSFTLVEPKAGRFARYCHVSCSSRDESKHIISQLSGAGLLGNALEVRPFYQRDLSNERRRAGWRLRPWLGVERRLGERRLSVE